MIKNHYITKAGETSRVSQMKEDRNKRIEFAERFPSGTEAAAFDFYLEARFRISEDRGADRLETWDSWVSAMQMHYAIFAVANTPEGSPVACLVDHETRTFRGSGEHDFAQAGKWLNAFYLAVTCRYAERWTNLCQVPVDLLKESARRRGGTYNEYTYHWISALQSLVLGKPGFLTYLDKAIELCSPRSGAFGGDALTKYARPSMEVFRFLALNDSSNFNKSLAETLESYRGYCTADTSRATDINALIPLPLLAFSCWAYDKSMERDTFSFDVESDYLPGSILTGRWVEQFPI
jgi:hypothetical protein